VEASSILTQLPFDENSLIDLYERMDPAVVNIRVVDFVDESEPAIVYVVRDNAAEAVFPVTLTARPNEDKEALCDKIQLAI